MCSSVASRWSTSPIRRSCCSSGWRGTSGSRSRRSRLDTVEPRIVTTEWMAAPARCIGAGVTARDAARVVGDPIDVVTGAVLERTLEFRLPGDIPIELYRMFDSSRVSQRFALGWGCGHSLERSLIYDLDGITYTGPLRQRVLFSIPEVDGQTVVSGGLLLQRLSQDSYRLALPGETVMEFVFPESSGSAPLTRLVRGDGSVELSHDKLGRVVRITDRARTLEIAYVASGSVGSVILTGRDRAPRTLFRYESDPSENLMIAWDAYGHACRFEYDSNHRLTLKSDRRGYSFSYSYDAVGRCVRSAGEDGLWAVDLRYATAESKTYVTQADGGLWIYHYDENGTVTQITNPYGDTTDFLTNTDGDVVERVEASGCVSRLVYSQEGVILGELDSLGSFRKVGGSANRRDDVE